MNDPMPKDRSSVLVIDNDQGQLDTVMGQLRDHRLSLTAWLLVLNNEAANQAVLPRTVVDRAYREISSLSPDFVLVDVCLFEQTFEETYPTPQRSGTWTGPALIKEIRAKYPEQRIGSYSAFPTDDVTDIKEQRKKYGVNHLPHWTAELLTADEILAHV